MIQWLHISDLHIKNKNDADQYNFFSTLLKDCAEQRIKADFIVATGDFHNFGDEKAYTASQAFLCKLTNALHLDIQNDLFIVPGNHDVDHNGMEHMNNVQMFLTNAKLDASERLHQKEMTDQDLDYTHTLNQHPELTQKLLKDFGSYCKMAGTLIHTYQKKTDDYLNPSDVHVRTWNNRLNILHLNTAILSDGKHGHAEAVDINQACSDKVCQKLNKKLPTIVIGHHSFHDLHATLKIRLVQLFNQINVWVYLAGDKHRTNYKGDEYLIDRKINIDVWPNIIVGKAAAAIDDNYSEFCAALYSWDEHNTVTVQYLIWEPDSSGNKLICSTGRPFPMCSNLNSQLYFDLIDRLIKIRDTHPSFRLMKIDEELFPKAHLILDDCNVIGGRCNRSPNALSLSKFFIESWNQKKQNHIALIGEGGIGKTVALLSLTTKSGFLPRHAPAVYIPLYALKYNGNTDDCIGKYLLEETLNGDKQQFDELLKVANQKWIAGPMLVLLLDGFNEIHCDARFIVIRNIEEWSNKQGVQIIISSRFDIHCIFSNLSEELTTLRLQPLSRQQIQTHLLKTNTPPPSESALWAIIDYPLMLALYVQAEALQKKNSLIPLKWLEQRNAGTIVWNYLQRELWLFQSHTKDPKLLIQYVIATEIIAPFLAWEMVQYGQFLVSEKDFVLRIAHALTFLRTTDRKKWPEHVQQVIQLCGGMISLPDAETFSYLLTQQLNLFCRHESCNGSVVSLMHQRFRDCLAAIHLLNLSQAISDGDMLPEEWQKPIDYYVLNFLADLLTPESFIAEKLWQANRTLQPTARDATINLLELYKRYRNFDFSELNFSSMDLHNIHLHSYRKPGEPHLKLPADRNKMNKTIMSPGTFEPEGHADIITKIVLSPDNWRFISSSCDGIIQIWDINTCKSLHILEDHTSTVNDIVLSADGQICISASEDHTIRIWNIDTGNCMHVLEGHTDNVHAVAICSDGHTYASASIDGTIRLWNTKIQKPFSPILIFNHKQTKYIINVQAADNHYFVCVSEEEHIKIWNVAKRIFLPQLKGSLFYEITAVAMSPNGKRFVTATNDGLQIWDTSNGQCIASRFVFFSSLVITSDNSQIIGICEDQTLQVRSMKDLNCIKRISLEEEAFYITLMRDETQCMVSFFNHILVFDLINEQPLINLANASGMVVITPDGRRCICGEDQLEIWSLETYEKICNSDESSITISAVAITPDCLQCISASSDNLIRIWDINRSQLIGFMEKPCRFITALTITADGRQCIGISRDGTIQIWNMKTRKIENGRKLDDLWFGSAAITPDGRWCVGSIHRKGMIRKDEILLWDLASEKEPRKLPKNSCTSIALTADGNNLILSWNNLEEMGIMQIINLISEEKISFCWKPHGRGKLMANDQINDIAITPDGTCMVLGTCNDIVIWHKSIETTQIISVDEWVHSIAISPDGKRCVCGTSDTLYIRDVETGELISSINLISGIDLFNANLSLAIFKPKYYAKTAYQNGAIINDID